MAQAQLFRAVKGSHRFTQNQKVWVRALHPNHIYIWHRWRGSGRYVNGVIARDSPLVGELKTIEVDDEFANRIASGGGKA